MNNKPIDQMCLLKSDVELLNLYTAGNQDAVTVLIARYASLINKIVSNYHIDGADNDDIKQEAYMGLFNAIRSYNPGRCASFNTYANHCIANKLKNLFASASTHKAKIYKNSISIDEIEDYKISEKKLTNPEAIFIQNEGYESLLKLTNSVLSDFERNVMFLYLSGCDYSIIATKLNSSPKSVDNALQRARRKLKAVFNNI